MSSFDNRHERAASSSADARRRFIGRGLGLAGAAASLPFASRAAAPAGAVERPVADDPSKVPGYPLADESYGMRSQFETEVRQRYKTATALSSWTFTPLQDSIGIVTPSGLHLRAQPFRHRGDRSAKHDAVRARHGAAQEKYSMRDLRAFRRCRA